MFKYTAIQFYLSNKNPIVIKIIAKMNKKIIIIIDLIISLLTELNSNCKYNIKI